MGDPEPPAQRWRDAGWWIVAGICAAVVVVRNLSGLDASPPGLYSDEASIGYNAWTIAHFGVDEHGIRLPLFFEAFGEYKNPVYIYALSALLRVLPLTPAIERLPAALFGLAAVLFLTLAAWRLSGSRAVTLFTLALAALTPWLVQESRVGFETMSMVALLCAALWCLAGPAPSPRRFSAAGVLLAFAIFGYTTARLEILLFAAGFAVAWGVRRPPGWWRTLVPIVAGYAVLGIWGQLNPGALTARFNLISIAADGAPPGVVVGRFLANYVSYFGPRFLFEQGDLNPRHNTGFAGMLVWIMVPLLIAGMIVMWQRRHEPFVRFVAMCVVLAPVAAAVTNEGTPHSLRSAELVPFLIVVAVVGADGIRLALRGDRLALTAAATVLTGGLLAQGALYTVDMYTAYPRRAAVYFDTGQSAAISRAAALADGHTVFLSSNLDVPYIDAFFDLQPPPPRAVAGDDVSLGLAALRMRIEDPAGAGQIAAPGDLIVLSAADVPPPGASFVAVELGPADPFLPAVPRAVLATVYRLGG